MLILINKKFKYSRLKYNKGISKDKIKMGVWGLQSKEFSRISQNQLNVIKSILLKNLKKIAKYWIRINLTHTVSKKPLETRMGSGKGDIKYLIANIKPGTIICELDNINKKLALNILRTISFKLPFKTIIIKKLLN